MGGSTTVQAPAPVDPAQVGRDTLQTQLDLAPQVFAANQQYLPQYADLAQQVANSLQPGLLASQAGANTSQRTSDIADVRALAPSALEAWRAANPQLGQAQQSLSAAITAAGGAAPQVGRYTATAPTLDPAANAALPGMAATQGAQAPTMAPTAQAALPGMAPTARAGVAGLAPAALASVPGLGNAAQVQGQTAAPSRLLGTLETDAGAALGSISPIQLELQRQAMEQLGGDLTPAQIAKVQQDTRSAYAARGLYDSNQAIGAEILNTDAARAQRRTAAQQFAGQVDSAGQQQLAANRGYAGNVAGMGTQVSQFNAGQQQQAGLANQGALNQFGLTQYGTQAQLAQGNQAAINQQNLTRFGAQNQASLSNAAAQNQAGLTQFTTAADLAARNAAAQNQAGLAQYGTQADMAQRFADAQNQAGLTQFTTGAGINQANAAAQNQFALNRYATGAGLSQFNAGQNLQTDQLNAQLGLGAQQQNISNLFNLAQQYAANAQDPYQLVLGRSGAPAAAAGLAQQAGPTMFDPFNPAITQIYAGNQANQLAANTATANNNAAMGGGFMSALGSLGGAGIMALALCWVAREVYGAENPRWLEFRTWLLRYSPRPIFERYARQGERFSRLIAHRPRLKAAVREWMDQQLNQEVPHAC
jgi:hypothetical protein